MNKTLLTFPLSLMVMACPGPIPSPESVAQAVNRAVILEGSSALRCPKSEGEKTALRIVRQTFDSRYRSHMDPDQIDRLDEARKATNEKCGV